MFDDSADGAEARWAETWSLLGLAPPPGLLALLVERHREPHRHYHVLGHVLDCLGKAAASRPIQRRPAAVDLALWFHDAVYDTHRSDNEERSAELAAERLSGIVPEHFLAEVGTLVLATRHRPDPPPSGDAAVVADVDLTILGEPADRFDAYQAAIRREYSWVPSFVYRRRRARLLEGFLARERIYATDRFYERYEAAARRNLARALREA